MIDVTQAPYNCRFDWTGSDSAATDNYGGLQEAIYDAACLVGPGVDQGGAIGDVLQLPRGCGMVSQKLVLPFGVSMQGQAQSYYATVLKPCDTFDPDSHFIDAGDGATELAAMGCGIQNMILWARPTMEAAPNRAMFFTNNAQDTDPIVGRCRIYAGNRAAIWAERGWGGATLINFRNITCHNNGGPGSTPIIWANYGDGTTVHFDGVQVANPAGGNNGSYGLYLVGGNFVINRYHAEQVWTGCVVDLANGGRVEFSHGQGGNDCERYITINNRPSQIGKTRVRNTDKNGSLYTVCNGLPGGLSVQTDIVAEQVF